MFFKNSNEKAIFFYTKIAMQSRKPFFFKELKIENNFEGRLEILIFNLVLVIWALKKYNELEDISQELCDIFFQDLDNSLRELGVSDLSVGRKIKILAENYFGRVISYTESFDDFLTNKKVDLVIKKINNNFKFKNNKEIINTKFNKYVSQNILYFSSLKLDIINSAEFKFKVI